MKQVAIIEVDTRACRLVIAKYSENSQMTIVEEAIEPVRINDDIEIDHIIKPARVVDTLNILKNFKKQIEKMKIDTVIGYSTQNFLGVKNQRSFIEELYNTLGFRFDILTDEKLNSLIHLSNANTMEQIKAIVVNIDYNCINFVKYNRRNIIETISFDFGTDTLLHLAEKETSFSPEEKMQLMVDYAKTQFSKTDFFKDELDEYKKIGMGSAFTNVGKITRILTKYPLSIEHNYELKKTNFDKAYSVIEKLDFDKSKKIKGVDSDSSDTVSSGFAIIKALYETFSLDKFFVNQYKISNGMIYNELNNVFGDRPIGDILNQSLESCNFFYDSEENNNSALYNIANDLFDELRVLHRYTKAQQKVLKIASYFATSGKRIGFNNFEKNSFFIVLNSAIYGATQREILLASFVSASQNIEEFDFSRWVGYKDILEDGDEEIVRKMAVLVKLARLIDKSKTVDHIACDVLGDKCILNIVPKASMETNIDEINKVVPDFKKAYQKQLQIL